jgi:hypothetical protein
VIEPYNYSSTQGPAEAEYLATTGRYQVAAWRQRKIRPVVVAHYDFTNLYDDDLGIVQHNMIRAPVTSFVTVDSMVSDLQMTISEDESPHVIVPPSIKRAVTEKKFPSPVPFAAASQRSIKQQHLKQENSSVGTPSRLKSNPPQWMPPRRFFPEDDDEEEEDEEDNEHGTNSRDEDGEQGMIGRVKSSVSWADDVYPEHQEGRQAFASPATAAPINQSISALTTPPTVGLSPHQPAWQARGKKTVPALHNIKPSGLSDQLRRGLNSNRDAPSSISDESHGRPDAPPYPMVQPSTSSLTAPSFVSSSWSRVQDDVQLHLPPVSEDDEREADDVVVVWNREDTFRVPLHVTTKGPSRELGILSVVETAHEATSQKQDGEGEDEEETSAAIRSCRRGLEQGLSIQRGEQRIVRLEQVVDKSIRDPYGDIGVYTGILVGGKPCGQGAMMYKDGRKYVGEWENGRWDGRGRTTYSNGDIFFGQYRMDKRHGLGRYEWLDGRVYDGEFANDQREGKGTFSFPDGSVYSGGFRTGQRHGQGCYKFTDSAIYNGEFQNGKYHGTGECIWADGRCYLGEWVEGRANGYGVEIRADGSIRHDGEWRDDRPVRCKGKVQLSRNLSERGGAPLRPRLGPQISNKHVKTDAKSTVRERGCPTPERLRSDLSTQDATVLVKVTVATPENIVSYDDPPAPYSKYAIAGEPKWSKRIRAKKQACRSQSGPVQRTLIRD